MWLGGLGTYPIQETRSFLWGPCGTPAQFTNHSPLKLDFAKAESVGFCLWS